MSRDGGDIVNELRDSKVRLKEERDAAEIRREQAQVHSLQVEKDAKYWEDRALTAESALMDLEARLDKKKETSSAD